jgi:hypothetical protein
MTAAAKPLAAARDTSVDAVIAAARATLGRELPPGSLEAQEFCAKLSTSLLNDTRMRPFPELQALGFWLRPASLTAMLGQYLGKNRTPAGVVFQIPPANVDALFGYTLAIGLLCGNVSIIRLPSATRPAQEKLAEILEEHMRQAPAIVRERVAFLRYGHDDTITAKLSSACDARLVWGSDATVEHMRSLPARPGARDILFGDRFSAAALNATYYLKAGESQRDALVKNLFNDIYWFDQLACSSPRLLVWIGNADDAGRAAADLYPRLAGHAVARGYDSGAGGSLAKLTAAYLALHDLAPKSYRIYAPQLSVIALGDLAALAPFKPVNYGHGLLMEARLDRLGDLVRYTEKCDQTLAVWGFEAMDAQTFAAQERGRGYSRVVPVGQALNFDAEWEGVNLFEVLTRPKDGRHD